MNSRANQHDGDSAVVYVVDPQPRRRRETAAQLAARGWRVERFGAAGEFLDACKGAPAGCVLAELLLPDMTAARLRERMATGDVAVPLVVLSDSNDARLAVRLMQAGAVDFLPRPVDPDELAAAVARAIEADRRRRDADSRLLDVRNRLARLTPQEGRVVHLLLDGRPNKSIAQQLGVSPRTADFRRASVLRKMGVRSVLELARLLAASGAALPADGVAEQPRELQLVNGNP
jgi:two-component system response regulator FixJ